MSTTKSILHLGLFLFFIYSRSGVIASSISIPTTSPTRMLLTRAPSCSSDCGVGQLCTSDINCASGVCNGICQVLNCDDERQNGVETGVDCGGSCAAECVVVPQGVAHWLSLRSKDEQLAFITALVLLGVAVFAWLACCVRSLLWGNRRDVVQRSKVLQQVRQSRNLADGLVADILGDGMKGRNARDQVRRGTTTTDDTRTVETCQLMGDLRTLEGWVKVRQKNGGLLKRYCVLYGGAEPALCVYDDMVGGNQGSLLIGESLRVRVVDIGNVESVTTGGNGLVVWYTSAQQREKEEMARGQGRGRGGRPQGVMEAVHMLAVTRRDRDQWVGVLRSALLEGMTNAQRRMDA